jgi:hypothetical protein
MEAYGEWPETDDDKSLVRASARRVLAALPWDEP